MEKNAQCPIYSVNQSNQDGDTLLHLACASGSFDEVQMLIQRGAIINRQNNRGETPLHRACSSGVYEIVDFLLIHGAAVNRQNKFGDTPLHYAKDHEGIVQLLLNYGADSTRYNHYQDLPLHLACTVGQVIVVTLLLSHTPSQINITNKEGNTPLHVACYFQQNELIQLLVQHGADVNQQNHEGQSALHIVSKNSSDILLITFLLECGAQIFLTNKAGLTPLAISKKVQNVLVGEFLEKYQHYYPRRPLLIFQAGIQNSELNTNSSSSSSSSSPSSSSSSISPAVRKLLNISDLIRFILEYV